MPALEAPRIQAVCEYSEAEQSAEWTFSYAGPRRDVSADGDGLALAVLKGLTESMDWDWDEAAALPNRLRVRVR